MTRRHRLYWAWHTMKQRCSNPRATAYRHYGGRGIRVCHRWQTFENFAEDMGERPPGATLDRIDNNGNYEPGNCRWATRKEQYQNTHRRPTQYRGPITWNGVTRSATEWARTLGLSPGAIAARLSIGWTLDRALTTPSRRSEGAPK